MAGIVLKDIKKVYPGDVVAVHECNLEIADKEFIILVGPSGCGKSTTLRMIAGLEEISGGDLIIGNKRMNDVAPKDRDIAMVFQNYALYPHMTVYDNMAFGLALRKVPKKEIDRSVREAAEALNLTEYLNRKPKALSGGQRQRVALGRAMVRNPSVFLLDEPLSNLDAKLRTQMRTVISKLHKKLGTTFVYVTHDQTEAMTMGDRIVVMKDGFIQQVDTPQHLYDQPCNLFVAGFIGSPQMNFMDATISEKNGAYYLDFLGYSMEIPSEKGGNQVFASYVGKDLVVGLRPEDFHTEDRFLEATMKATIQANIDLVEPMGAEIFVYLECKGTRIMTRTHARFNGKIGECISIAIDMNKIHLFDKQTQEAICH